MNGDQPTGFLWRGANTTGVSDEMTLRDILKDWVNYRYPGHPDAIAWDVERLLDRLNG